MNFTYLLIYLYICASSLLLFIYYEYRTISIKPQSINQSITPISSNQRMKSTTNTTFYKSNNYKLEPRVKPSTQRMINCTAAYTLSFSTSYCLVQLYSMDIESNRHLCWFDVLLRFAMAWLIDADSWSVLYSFVPIGIYLLLVLVL